MRKGEWCFITINTIIRKMANILEEFVKCVIEYPNNIAIVDDYKSLTYTELYNMSCIVKNYILDKKMGKGKVIAVMGYKSVYSIVALLGIIMSGNIYLPIDCTYPAERINYIVSNSGAKFIIYTDKNKENINYEKIYSIHDIIECKSNNFCQNVNVLVHEKYCYILYTSGSSSNRPNGVLVSHAGICNTISWRIRYYRLNSEDILLLFASLAFDSSIEDIFSALSVGAKLIMVNDIKKVDPRYLGRVICEQHVNCIMLVPSVYDFLLDYIYMSIQNLKRVILAGERVNERLVEKHFTLVKNVRLYNEYGPTENSVCSTCGELHEQETITIGKCIDNVHYYLVNEKDEITSETGELCLYGMGLAAGYWNNSKLTKDRFKQNKLTGNGVAYYTGDIVKVNKKKELEYIGRKDSQIKVAGVRFDLNEISDLCLKYSLDIEKAITTCINDNCKYIIGLFYIEKRKINIEQLKKFLKSNLPNNIMPHIVMPVKEFFYLPNGKIDENEFRKILKKSF